MCGENIGIHNSVDGHNLFVRTDDTTEQLIELNNQIKELKKELHLQNELKTIELLATSVGNNKITKRLEAIDVFNFL